MANFLQALKDLLKSAEKFANQRFGPYGFYICIAAVVLVLVMAIVVPVAIVASSTASKVDPYPDAVTVTWRNSAGTRYASTAYVPEQGVYTRTGASLDGSLFNTDFMAAFGNLTCYQVYQYSDKFAFVKYSDDAGINRFALLGMIDLQSIKVSTAEDVGVSKDPSTYVGAWDYEKNSLAADATTYLDVSSTYY